MLAVGAAGKTPAWRVGSWLAGAALLLLVPLGRGRTGLVETTVVLGVGLLLTAPHGLARLGGAPPYQAPDSSVRLRPVGVPTYLLYLLLVRLPVAVGDVLYTAAWRALGEGRARRDRTPNAGSVAAPLPYAQEEATWPPLGPLLGDGAGARRRGLGATLRRAGRGPRR